jgi:hypothetical protein
MSHSNLTAKTITILMLRYAKRQAKLTGDVIIYTRHALHSDRAMATYLMHTSRKAAKERFEDLWPYLKSDYVIDEISRDLLLVYFVHYHLLEKKDYIS